MTVEVITKLRRDDGLIVSVDSVDGTYSFDHQKISMPTTYYKYSIAQLVNTGAFTVIKTAVINNV